MFSLEDMVKVKKGLLAPLLKDILKASLEHVASCEVRAPCPGGCVPELSFLQPILGALFCTCLLYPHKLRKVPATLSITVV